MSAVVDIDDKEVCITTTIIITAQTVAKILAAQDARPCPKFWADKYEAEAKKNWDKFYKRHQTNVCYFKFDIDT